jgi:uncharacterized membrane protein
MTIDLEAGLERWVEAQILDRQQADRIRQLEVTQLPRSRARWPVMIAVAFGGMMLAAGVLLFVSAHWDELSPFQRMALLVGAVGAFHVGGALTLERFRALGVTLHAVGTVALGGAIAMAGQIFNMQEHWPTAALMWAVGAIAGWLLLGDWPHVAITAILVPFWLAGEWTEVAHSRDVWPVITSGVLLLAICYLGARMAGDAGSKSHVRTALTWLGGIALLPAALVASLSHRSYCSVCVDTSLQMLVIGWCGAILLPLGLAYALRGKAAWMNAVAAIWVVGLSILAEERMETAIYCWCGLGAAALVAWGVYESRAERINLGMAGFGLTVVLFFFSSVMDKLDRSASLIAPETGGEAGCGRRAMTLTRKGLIVAAFQCALVLSLSGKLLYDGSTCPRVWVKAAPWDPSLPIRGRYLALRLAPELGAKWYTETNGKMVLFFVPEHTLPFETTLFKRDAPEVWVEVTIPRKGPPRPIRLSVKKAGTFEAIEVN